MSKASYEIITMFGYDLESNEFTRNKCIRLYAG